MKLVSFALFGAALFTGPLMADEAEHRDDASTIPTQNAALDASTYGKGFGPQSPRDLSKRHGTNSRAFSPAPPYDQMNLCNIHFHESAEHRGGQFTKFAGDGDGRGQHTGFRYSGTLSAHQSRPLPTGICIGKHGALQVGDTIELHYMHSTAQVKPGPTLNSCLSEENLNPQLRVEVLVLVLVNDDEAADFLSLTQVGERRGYQQALNIPQNAGKPVRYAGSTTGPSYNEKGSPLQVSWSVYPKVIKVHASSVGRWCEDNPFNETHAHGVRNLVTNPKLLSRID